MDSNFLFAIILGYLLGSIPFAQLVAKVVKGIDLRTVGSRNVGGHNLTHQVGLKWGVVGGALDVVKGLASLWTAISLGVPYPAYLLAGSAAVVGHNWPVWLRFRGGKGLAAALGGILWVAGPEGLVAFALSMLVLWRTKNVLLMSVTGFATIFLLIPLFDRQPEVPKFVLLQLLIVAIASLPDVLKKARTRGGVVAYMKDPSQVYREEASKRKP